MSKRRMPEQDKNTAVFNDSEGFSKEQGNMARIPVTIKKSESRERTEHGRLKRSSRSTITIPAVPEASRMASLADLLSGFFTRSRMMKKDSSTSNDNAISVCIGISLSLRS